MLGTRTRADAAQTPRTGREGAPAIRIEGVSKAYRTAEGRSVLALHDVSLEVPAGKFLSIVGPSGCGKSTLMMLVAGLLAPTKGSVQVGTKTVKEPYTAAGIVFQRDVLLEWRTALDNLLLQAEMRGLPKNQHRQRAMALLEMAGLTGFEQRYPSELSGGMRQRVSICRALLLEPPLLLMDEPFGALDALTREQMQLELGHYLASNTTVVFITHSLDEAVFLSDRVVVMSRRPGRIRAVIDVELERPRRAALKASHQFEEYSRQIREIFLREGILQERAS